nr:MAG TPA: Toxin APETx1 elegantissima, sea anemone toxin [Caudoviricetes sp.]
MLNSRCGYLRCLQWNKTCCYPHSTFKRNSHYA